MCLGVPGRVLDQVDVVRQVVLVDVQGRQQQVSAAMMIGDQGPLPQPGDWVIVHLGFAMSRMEESEARSVLQLLDDLTDMYADQLDAHASAARSQQPS